MKNNIGPDKFNWMRRSISAKEKGRFSGYE